MSVSKYKYFSVNLEVLYKNYMIAIAYMLANVLKPLTSNL